ncbi:MAG: ATP-binding protein [Verrucomicrobiales bacterium]
MSDFVFALENATWPAILVDAAAYVRFANAKAKKVFGSGLDLRPNLAKAVWAKENELAPDQFLASFEQDPKSGYPVKLKVKDGSVSSFTARVCSLSIEEENLFLLQIFELDSSSASTTSKTPSVAESPSTKLAETAVLENGAALKQKLECALQLTRTVALDFNNALTSILGHTSLLLARADAAPPFRESLVEIEKSAEKAAEIAHDLAAFSRPDKDAKVQQTGNLNQVIRNAVDALKSQAGDRIAWKMELEKKLYGAQFDEAKLQQAFVKIIENAVQAIPASGAITVATQNIESALPFEDGGTKLHEGNYVKVTILDTGIGITQDALSRIFEPFYTTKKENGHRGLGLAWVYGIVTNHGGAVAVSSKPAEGTSVRIYLPAQKKLIKDHIYKADDEMSGNQLILLVDDEDLLLTMGEMVLSSFGYTVLTANSGAKAIEIFKQQPDKIDLVITDLVMPQMSGREVIEQLRKINPSIRVICASGYMRTTGPEEEDTYLQKPFASQDLLRKVKQVLGADLDK